MAVNEDKYRAPPFKSSIWNFLPRCCVTQTETETNTKTTTQPQYEGRKQGANLPRQCRNLPLSSLSPAHCCHSLSCHSRQLAKTRAHASKNRNSPQSCVQSCTCNTYISFAWGNLVSFVALLAWGTAATGLVLPGDGQVQNNSVETMSGIGKDE